MISYAQNMEDVRLARVFPGEDGFFLDVGAADPVSHSVTKWFSEQGWKGINIEPLPSFFTRVCDDRPWEINLNLALAEQPSEMEFFEVADCIGWSTLDPATAEKLREAGNPLVGHRIEVSTLRAVCEEHVGRQTIDFLKIDVEGAERSVILGADWKRWRPRVVVVEATEQDSPVPNHHNWEDLLLAADYRFAVFDGLNRFYVRAEDEDLIPTLQLSPNVFDKFTPHEVVQHQQKIAELEAKIAVLTCDLKRFEARHGYVLKMYEAALESRRTA